MLSLVRLNIPPFVPARKALEGLESEDYCEDEKPVKDDITEKKVKQFRQKLTFLRLRNSLTALHFLTLRFFVLIKRTQTKLKRKG